MEEPEIKLHKYTHLIFEKGSKEEGSPKNGAEAIGCP